MRFSLKSKFFIFFGALTVFIFLTLGIFLVREKERELSLSIAESSQNFAETTVFSIMNAYGNYFAQGNTLPFEREIQAILRKNLDISQIMIVDYNGTVLYSSDALWDQDSEANSWNPSTADLPRIQSQNISISLDTGPVIFVKVEPNGEELSVDFNENPVEPYHWEDRILNIVVPYDNQYAVIYTVNYDRLNKAISQERFEVIFGALLALSATLMASYVMSSSITQPLQDLKEGAKKLASGDFRTRVESSTKDEIGVLAESFNQMAQDLESSTQSRIFEERVAKELELAANIQKSLLPEEKLRLRYLDVAGGVVPASEIGGDMFDYLPVGDLGYLIYLGDVTGHGVPAGIVSSITSAVLYTLSSRDHLKDALASLNKVIRKKTSKKVFVTMALLYWDEKTQALSYWNAGHPPILHFKAASKVVDEIHSQGMAIGLVDDLQDRIHHVDLKMDAGDIIVLYSDGIPEAKNPKGEEYGRERLKNLLQNISPDLNTSEGIKNAILSDVIQYVGKDQHEDDMTVVVLKRL